VTNPQEDQPVNPFRLLANDTFPKRGVPMKTMMSMYTLLYVVLAFSQTAHAIEKPNIDLYKGTLNGRVFYTLTIDDITDLLGRPSHQWKPEGRGAHVFYPDLGLALGLESTSKKCRAITIDISGKTIDKIPPKEEVKNMNVKKYNGVLSKNIDGNWKLKRVMEEFKDNNPKAGEMRLPGSPDKSKEVNVKFSNYQISFLFDEVTEFLDAIIIIRNE
jgi:hypothetical protein